MIRTRTGLQKLQRTKVRKPTHHKVHHRDPQHDSINLQLPKE